MNRRRLIDIYTEDQVFVWLQFEPLGREDLEPAEAGDLSIGDRPQWLDDELRNDGWTSLLAKEWSNIKSGEGWDFGEGWFRRMLKYGLVPCQRFLVRIGKPEYHSWQTMDGWDCDVDYDFEFMGVDPIPVEETIAGLEEYVKDLRAGREEAVCRMRELKEKRRTDKSAMYIAYTYYYHKSYNEMCPPDGIQIALCSRHTNVEGIAKYSWPELAIGRSDIGDRDAARKEMRKRAKEAGIKLTSRDWERISKRGRW